MVDSEIRRTLVFAVFGGSKFGNLASTEWVLQNKKKIENRVVAYINLDEIITSVETNQLESGKFSSLPEVKPEVVRKKLFKAFVASGSPLMKKIVAEVMREIFPDASRAESSFAKTARVRGTLFEVNQG